MTESKSRHPLKQSLAAVLLIALGGSDISAEVGNPRVNQVGYIPQGPKVATLRSTGAAAVTWELRQHNTVVASGTTIPKGFDTASGETVHQIDFSNVTLEGSGFKLYANGDESYSFAIGNNIMAGALYDSIRYFYHNRSGIEIQTPYTGGGSSSYAANARWARPAGHLNAGVNNGDFDVPCWPGTCNYALDVTKGWYDAGDHGKYVVNGGISVWKLLNMYERALHLSDNAADFADGMLNIPESGNGVADILDEVRWQLEFLLAMQVPVGQPQAGMVHHKMHDQGWTGLPLAPHEDPNPRYLVPPSTAATLNLAAVGAQCARLWAGIDPNFADTCLDAAERAWAAAQSNPNALYTGGYDNGGGGYGDEDVSDEFYWAAAELFITTGNSRYASELQPSSVDYYYWGETELPGVISLATVPAGHSATQRSAARQRIIGIANNLVSVIDSEGYHTTLTNTEYVWGSNNGMANKLAMVGLAYDFTGDERYARAFIKATDYLFGRNPLSLSYVTGHGEIAVTQPHHRFWAGALSGSYPWAPPGALAGGPNTGLEDSVAQSELAGCESRPQTCFIDNIGSWSTNEITINWNSILSWVLAFYVDYARTQSGSNTSPIASMSVDVNSGAAPLQVSFDGSGSSDGDGDSLTYTWNFGDGASATGVSTSHTYTQAGTFVATLTVNDGKAGSGTDSATITVTDEGGGGNGGGDCEYIVNSEWNTGFTASIRITNNGDTAINGWEVNWTYTNGSRITSSWNANLSGSNPYTASGLSWNSVIAPGNVVEFGLQGTKGTVNTPAEVPGVTGDVCG